MAWLWAAWASSLRASANSFPAAVAPASAVTAAHFEAADAMAREAHQMASTSPGWSQSFDTLMMLDSTPSPRLPNLSANDIAAAFRHGPGHDLLEVDGGTAATAAEIDKAFLDEIGLFDFELDDVLAANSVSMPATSAAAVPTSGPTDSAVELLAARLAADKTALALAEAIASTVTATAATASATDAPKHTTTTPMKKRKRKRKIPVPEHLKDEKYRRKRLANTLAARRSRERDRQQKALRAAAMAAARNAQLAV